jgi:UDP-N-acetylmuramate--alanine ligase
MLRPDARIHFIGIGGTGLSAIATVLHEEGYAVSGCDLEPGPLGAALAARGVPVWRGHDPAHVTGGLVDVVVVTSAAPREQPEVAAARAAGLPVLKRADFLGELMAPRIGVAVAGAHGKTTTTAMISYVLLRAGFDPTFIVGGTLRDLGTNAGAGRGAPFVIEADEYDRMFLGLRPRIAVVTNIEHDHPDIFPTPEAFEGAFRDFAERLPEDGLLVACADDPGARNLGAARRSAGRPVQFYGLAEGDWQLREVRASALGGLSATVVRRTPDGEETLGAIGLRVPGRHNLLNALATLVVADALGVPFAAAAAALGEFSGVGRRFELRGEAGGVTVVDDYGHHPTEIRTTLAAARERFAGRPLWAVWQPHTYSRTRALLEEFAAAFESADHAIVTDVYASRERDTLGLSAADVVARMRHPDARHIGPLAAVADYLLARLAPGDVLIVFSAGDAPEISERVLRGLAPGGLARGPEDARC